MSTTPIENTYMPERVLGSLLLMDHGHQRIRTIRQTHLLSLISSASSRLHTANLSVYVYLRSTLNDLGPQGMSAGTHPFLVPDPLLTCPFPPRLPYLLHLLSTIIKVYGNTVSSELSAIYSSYDD